MAGNRFPIVGIGASAGSIEALQAFFQPMPAEPGMAFIVVMHLGEHHESVLPQILARATALPIAEVHDGEMIEPNHVYVLTSNALPTVRRGRVRLLRQTTDARERNPIDVLFASLAEDIGDLSIGVILSGTGHDGTLGAKAIKEKGGLTVAQKADHSAPQYPEMPANAIASGSVDLQIGVEEMGQRLVDYVSSLGTLENRGPNRVEARQEVCDHSRRPMKARQSILASPGIRPTFAAAATEDLLFGERLLRRAFLGAPARFVGRGGLLLPADAAEPQLALIRSGFVCRSCTLADGRRSIVDILLPSDIAGLDELVLARPFGEFVAASRVGCTLLSAADVRQLMVDRRIALRLYSLLAEARNRTSRLAVSIGRLDALARISLLLLDIHDRLRRSQLIMRPTFNLPLTQEQIADHLGLTYVHVNRTLRRLREQGLAIVDRQVVIILDLDRLRKVAEDLPVSPDLPMSAEPVPEAI